MIAIDLATVILLYIVAIVVGAAVGWHIGSR